MAHPAQAESHHSRQQDDPGAAATHDLAALLTRYHEPLAAGLRQSVARLRDAGDPNPAIHDILERFYGQMEYHLGWRRADLRPAQSNSGKLLRPTLLLLACELAAGRLGGDDAERVRSVTRALPAAVAVELVHNFSLIHDDIEDGDEQRRHRPTLWRVWGQPQAINTGDGMFALARLTLFDLLDTGVPAAEVARLAVLLDRTCLRLCEGQHLDMSFEGRHNVTTAMYLEMIERKTAALMACALEMGARLGGADDALAASLAAFGRALGLGFQLRDDLLGIWASHSTLGKSEAGDLRRKKMSLPIIHALAHADPAARAALLAVYATDGPATDDQIALVLDVLDRTGARQHLRGVLRHQCDQARAALAMAAGNEPGEGGPAHALGMLVDLVAAEAG